MDGKKGGGGIRVTLSRTMQHLRVGGNEGTPLSHLVSEL